MGRKRKKKVLEESEMSPMQRLLTESFDIDVWTNGWNREWLEEARKKKRIWRDPAFWYLDHVEADKIGVDYDAFPEDESAVRVKLSAYVSFAGSRASIFLRETAVIQIQEGDDEEEICEQFSLLNDTAQDLTEKLVREAPAYEIFPDPEAAAEWLDEAEDEEDRNRICLQLLLQDRMPCPAGRRLTFSLGFPKATPGVGRRYFHDGERYVVKGGDWEKRLRFCLDPWESGKRLQAGLVDGTDLSDIYRFLCGLSEHYETSGAMAPVQMVWKPGENVLTVQVERLTFRIALEGLLRGEVFRIDELNGYLLDRILACVAEWERLCTMSWSEQSIIGCIAVTGRMGAEKVVERTRGVSLLTDGCIRSILERNPLIRRDGSMVCTDFTAKNLAGIPHARDHVTDAPGLLPEHGWKVVEKFLATGPEPEVLWETLTTMEQKWEREELRAFFATPSGSRLRGRYTGPEAEYLEHLLEREEPPELEPLRR